MKEKTMPDSRFNELQNKIDAIVAQYLETHPHFVEVAITKDASLKGKNSEDVKKLLAVYPGVIAVAVNQVAHQLNNGSNIEQVQARALSEAAHTRSGIDIHPGTQIGEDCFIDHGTGVVIGETAKIGRNTLLYHGVTLGAYGNPEEANPEKLAHRHPVIGDNCTVSVGAQVLGNVKIGNDVVIGPNATLFGNRLTIGNGVSIGTGAQIGDDNMIADHVRIGAGAVIPKGIGRIEQDVPPYSKAGLDVKGELEFGVTIPLSILKKVSGVSIQPSYHDSYMI